MKNYVIIFTFNTRGDKVLLIKKTKRPAHHVGLLNGVGGKVEEGETGQEAAEREFTEETGIPVSDVVTIDRYGCMQGGGIEPAWHVTCYYAVVDFADDFSVDTEEGPIEAYDVCDAMDWKAVPNVSWLVPMAYEAANDPDFDRGGAFYNV